LDLENVVRRLERLEKQNRRLKCLGLALAACCALGLLAAAQPARDKTGDFEQLVLRDKSGKQRAAFDMGKEGPNLRFLDDDGKDYASIGTAKGGMYLRLNNREGSLQTGINLNPAGVVVVSYGATGRLLSGTNAIQETTGGFTRQELGPKDKE
jgi:hypothetical protein